MQAEIIFTGTELLLGQIINTHGQYLGRELAELGIEVTLQTTVGDNRETLQSAIKGALARTDLLIITGGLGPTEDDLTCTTVAEIAGLDMVVDQGILRSLETLFARRGLPMPENMKKQALIPRGATVLPNSAGTAPGLIVRHGQKYLVMLPGPAPELKAVFDDHLRSFLQGLAGSGVIMDSTVLKVAGLSESQVQERLMGLHTLDDLDISYVALPGEVYVRLTARAADARLARETVQRASVRVEKELGDYVFGRDDELLEEIVGAMLSDREMTVSAAESCTGGLVMKRLTEVAGSSRYFVGGIVSYSNDLKIKLLGVPPEILSEHGAVSEQTARAMAEGVRRVTGSSLGLGVTGIAGPDGGTPVKPLGLVYIALAAENKTFCQRHVFPGQRAGVRAGAANTALNMIRRYFLGRLEQV